MYKFCVFAGTTEGRRLVDFLAGQDCRVTACVATEYGQTLLQSSKNLTVSAKRLTQEEMTELFTEEKFDLVVDATHPYASIVTENIASACAAAGTEYLRLLRGSSKVSDEAVFVPDIEAAVAYLNGTQGNILLTTGSKELHKFTALDNFADRVYARVLPMDASLKACQDACLKPAHIIAMQGPFSQGMNEQMLSCTAARYLVTKDGGDTGGFAAKANAAAACGAELVVIGRPPQREGLTLGGTVQTLCSRFNLVRRPEVTIVGIGPGSEKAMTGEVRKVIAEADCLIGAKRMLQAVANPEQPSFDAIVPEKIADYIHNNCEYQSFAVVMSGDSGFYSGTKKLVPLLSDCNVRVLPGLSSLSYLCARLQNSYEDVKVVSLHGRQHNIAAEVRENPKVFALVGGENGIAVMCRALCDAGLGHVKVSVGQQLSYPDEKITIGTAAELAEGTFDSLSVALIENETPNAVVTQGLPDEMFQRGGSDEGVVPMTKSEVRAVSLSKLRLTKNAVCYDVGAGTGSVAIEMALQARRGSVYAIERKDAAIALLKVNKEKFGVDNMTVVEGSAPDALADLPAPTHAFIGGSSGNMRQILELLLAKNPNVRIVATAIALETVAELTSCMRSLPFTETEVVCMNVARSKKAGPYNLMTGNNPVYIFTMHNRGEVI